MSRGWIAWVLAVAAIGAGHASYGWPGVALAGTVIVFWLLLDFSRAMRAMRRAATAPKGSVPSAVMLAARLRPGMTMVDVLPLAGSLGEPVSGVAGEHYRWTDAGGSAVVAIFGGARLQSWDLQRPETNEGPDEGPSRTA
ncbi:hypothetical protein [uncultured Methylibium sp.]|uniref:hypothetical protein n=1 Tax=uncultured Methylibium sp. TaxID=381093 RepID=UPI0025D3B3F9|nr:hypothetical protein [uncultured Methylibium sp.]